MGVGPVCQTSLSTGLSEWELGPRMQNSLLQGTTNKQFRGGHWSLEPQHE